MKRVSWRMIAEGTFYGFLCMLVAEEPVLNWLMPMSWLLFLFYLICRYLSHSMPKWAKRLHEIGRPCRIWGWILISGASLISSIGR